MDKSLGTVELDELYWFIKKKGNSKTRENVYIITMVSRKPRQIIGFDVGFDKTSKRIQRIVDSAPESEKYCTDGYVGYLDAVFSGEHIYNVHNKNDTFTVEGVNADLRHYIPLLRRRSRCFARSIDTLQAVVEVFADVYNRFGAAKFNYCKLNPSRTFPFGFVDFLFER